MNRLIRVVFYALGGWLIYRYRFRIINTLLAQPAIRKYTVAAAMKMPFVRDKVLKSFI